MRTFTPLGAAAVAQGQSPVYATTIECYEQFDGRQSAHRGLHGAARLAPAHLRISFHSHVC